MWLISGPFDGKKPGEVDFIKTKLLKAGRTYILGRKAKQPTQLVVSHPKVSAEQSSFIVGEHSTADVTDPSVTPSLLFHNLKTKALHVGRGDERLIVNPLAQQELQHGDVIALVGGIHLTVRWRPICCFSARGNPTIDFNTCADLGIKVVPNPHPDITHHLTPTLSVTPSISTSMLTAAQLVKPEWLSEFIRLGSLTDDESPADSYTTLEFEYHPPSETKYRPAFAPNLPTELKTFRTWEPNEERVGMLRGWHIVFIGEKGREVDGENRQLVTRGGAICEIFDVGDGRAKFQQVVKKIKKKVESSNGKGLALITDEGRIKAGGEEHWDELQSVLKSFGLRHIKPQCLLEAVVHVETSRIDSSIGSDSQEGSSPLPDFVPNTHPDEPSVQPEPAEQVVEAPAPRKRLRRLATPSRAQSPQAADYATAADPPVPVEGDLDPPRVRRKLTRLAKTGTPLLGVDDPSVLESQSSGSVDRLLGVAPDAAGESSSVSTPVEPTPGRPKKLKRKAAEVNAFLRDLEVPAEDDTNAPPLKKFRALFDEADPGHLASQIPQDSRDIQSQSQTTYTQGLSQTQTQTDKGLQAHSRTAPITLPPVPEEAEESQSTSNPGGSIAGGTKRKSPPSDSERADGPGADLTKKRAIEKVNAIGTASRAPSADLAVHPLSTARQQGATYTTTGNAGAAPGKHDKDAEFLKALASTKKGKKNEDQFDREFNKLRISKPELQRDEQAKEWSVLDDFGDDGDLRGNFMVIVEMDVPIRNERPLRRGAEGRMDWEGKPDFKKFKRKDHDHARPVVELVVDDENDYGVGSAYWKGGASQHPSQSQSQSQGNITNYLQPSQAPKQATKPAPRVKPPSKTRSQARAFKVVNSDDSNNDDAAEPKNGSRKPRSRSQSVVADASRKKTRGGHDTPLFLNSDEGEEDEVRDQVMDGAEEASIAPNDESTLRSNDEAQPTPRRPRTAKKKAPTLVVDDDSDDGMTFKGKRKTRGR